MAICSECGRQAGFQRKACPECEGRAKERRAAEDAGLSDVQPWMLPRRHGVRRPKAPEPQTSTPSTPIDLSRSFAPALIVLGVVGLGYSLFIMNVSVPTGYGERVANLELMNRRQVYVIAAGFLLAIGVFLSVAGARDRKD